MFKSVERPFLIESMAYPLEQNFTDNYAFDGESHDFIEIVLVRSGRAEVAENDKIYLLNDSNMIIHAPMEFHRIKSVDGTSPIINNLSIKIQGTVPDALYDGVFELDPDECKEFISIFTDAPQFINGQSEDKYFGQTVAGRIESFIVKICAKNNKSNRLSSDAGALTYKRLVSTMQERILENLSLSDLAKINYISVSYVKSLFYRYTGTSPGIYYAKLRANEAARLISEGIPIARISELMNFSSPNYFSLFFKKILGQTPTEYRKSVVKK